MALWRGKRQRLFVWAPCIPYFGVEVIAVQFSWMR